MEKNCFSLQLKFITFLFLILIGNTGTHREILLAARVSLGCLFVRSL